MFTRVITVGLLLFAASSNAFAGQKSKQQARALAQHLGVSPETLKVVIDSLAGVKKSQRQLRADMQMLRKQLKAAKGDASISDQKIDQLMAKKFELESKRLSLARQTYKILRMRLSAGQVLKFQAFTKRMYKRKKHKRQDSRPAAR